MDGVAFGLGPVRFVQHETTFAVAQGQFHRVGQPTPDTLLVHQAVHHQVDAVLLVLVQGGHVVQGAKRAVHAHPGKAFGLELLELVQMGALLQFHQRGQDHEFGLLRQGQDVADDLVGGAGLDGAAALRAVHAAQTREKDA